MVTVYWKIVICNRNKSNLLKSKTMFTPFPKKCKACPHFLNHFIFWQLFHLVTPTYMYKWFFDVHRKNVPNSRNLIHFTNTYNILIVLWRKILKNYCIWTNVFMPKRWFGTKRKKKKVGGGIPLALFSLMMSLPHTSSCHEFSVFTIFWKMYMKKNDRSKINSQQKHSK